MSFTIEQSPNESVLIVTLHPDFNLDHELPFSNQSARESLDQAAQPLDVLLVIQIDLALHDLLDGVNAVAHNDLPLLQHPNIRETIFITESETLHRSAAGIRFVPVGGRDVPLFPSVAAALDYLRSR